ncbi:MAG: acetyl-CoA carboxylase biotin carboxyl carrier protein [Rhodospirillales bacterium]|nr:acetyl-CoA carboxylase biotin carboxyl carrier protein [Rhodospirillales bacterium]
MPDNKNTTNIDSDMVRTLAGLLDETGLTEIEYEIGGFRIRVARTAIPAPVHHAAPAALPMTGAALAAEDHASHPGAVNSPMVGVAYLSPEPGATAFIKVGDSISEGQTLLLIEAMKTFNPIRAPRAGKISRILIADGQPVEFGEPLLIIE